MKKNILILLFLIIFNFFINAKGFDDFKFASILDVIKLVEDDLKKQTSPGETYFGEKFAVPDVWGENDKLVKIDKKFSSRIDYLT